MKLASSVVHNWGELDLPLRISAAMGLLSGASLPIVYEFILPSFGGAPSIIGLALTIIYPPLALFVIPPMAGFVGTIALLLGPMSVEQRGIVGFIVFIASEEHTSELQSPCNLVCRPLLDKKKRR